MEVTLSECRFFHVEAGTGLRQLTGPGEALSARQRGGYVWMDLRDPTREELDSVAGPLGIHPLAVEDCLDEEQIPKIEDYPGHTFILFNRFTYRDKELVVEEVDFLLGKDFLVTVSGRGGSDRHAFEKVEALAGVERGTVEKGPDFLLHVILDHTVDSKLGAIEAMEDDIETAEEELLRDTTEFQLEVLVRLRRSLLLLRKSLFHEREILVKVCRKDSPYITEPAIYHFRDIYDHLTKFFEFSEMNRDILTSLMEMHLSLTNNRMTRVANRTNSSVRRLTLITTVFMPLTLLAGIGGMSEWSMMTGPANWKLAYPLFFLGMLAIGGTNYYLLRWLERRDQARPSP
jgi:magnesium transporter